jgi:hypothetical protein
MTEDEKQIIRATVGRVFDLILHQPIETWDQLVDQAIDDVEEAKRLHEQRLANIVRERGNQPPN